MTYYQSVIKHSDNLKWNIQTKFKMIIWNSSPSKFVMKSSLSVIQAFLWLTYDLEMLLLTYKNLLKDKDKKINY